MLRRWVFTAGGFSPYGVPFLAARSFFSRVVGAREIPGVVGFGAGESDVSLIDNLEVVYLGSAAAVLIHVKQTAYGQE